MCCVDAWRAYVRPAAQATACGLPVRLSDGGAGTLEAKLERRPENPGSMARRPNSRKKRDGQPIGVRTPYVYPTRGYGYVVGGASRPRPVGSAAQSRESETQSQTGRGRKTLIENRGSSELWVWHVNRGV